MKALSIFIVLLTQNAFALNTRPISVVCPEDGQYMSTKDESRCQDFKLMKEVVCEDKDSINYGHDICKFDDSDNFNYTEEKLKREIDSICEDLNELVIQYFNSQYEHILCSDSSRLEETVSNIREMRKVLLN